MADIAPMIKPDKDQAYAYWDHLTGEATKLHNLVDDLGRREHTLDYHQRKNLLQSRETLAHMEEQFVKDKDDPDLGRLYQQWHHERFGPKETVPASSEPGILDRFLHGVGETAKYAIQNPKAALSRAAHGAEGVVSVIPRVVESFTGQDPRIGPSLQSMREKREEKIKSMETPEQQANVGPAVAEAVGSMAVPLPPMFKAGEHLKNMLKGAGLSGGFYAGEQVAKGEPVLDEGLTTSAGVGGVASGLISLLTRGKGHAVEKGGEGSVSGKHSDPGSTPPDPTLDPTKTASGKTANPTASGPAAIEAPKVETGTQLSLPGVMNGKVKTSPLAEMPPQTGIEPKVEPLKGRQLSMFKKPAPVATMKPEDLQAAEAAQPPGVSLKNVAPGNPSATQLLTPHIPEAAAGIEAEKAARVAAGKTPENKPITPIGEGLKSQLDFVKARREAKPSVEPVQAKSASDKAVDDAMAELRAVLKGEKKVSEVKAPKRAIKEEEVGKTQPPKSEAPVNEAEPTGAITDVDFFGGKKTPVRTQPKRTSQIHDLGDIKLPENEGAAADTVIAEIEKRGITLGGKGSENIFKVGNRTFTEAWGAGPDIIESFPQKKAPGKIAEAKPQPTRAELLAKEGKPEAPTAAKKLEEFLQEKGFRVEEKHDPVEGYWYRVYDKEGKLRAQGRREVLTEAVSGLPEAKGFKLHSFPSGLEELPKELKSALDNVGSKAGPILQAFSKTASSAVRPFKTSQQVKAESPSMAEAMDVASRAKDAITAKYRDLVYKFDELTGNPHPTKFKTYLDMQPAKRDVVDKALWTGDVLRKQYTTEQLASAGMDIDQIAAYHGVRESLKEIRGEVIKEIKERARIKESLTPAELDMVGTGDIEGYMPRTWGGKYEVFVNGKKALRKEEGHLFDVSSFHTEQEAIDFAHKMKAKDPKAEVAIKHHADPEYLGAGPLAESLMLGRLKKNIEMKADIEKKASIDPKLIDEAWRYGRDLKSFARHLLQRKNAAGYDTANTPEIVNGYLWNASRFIENSKMKRAVGDIISTNQDLTPNQVLWLKDRVEHFAGKKTWDEIAIQNFVTNNPIGRWLDPKYSALYAIDTTKKLAQHLALGVGNIGYAIANTTSVLTHVYPALQREGSQFGLAAAEKYFAKGVNGYYNDKPLVQMLAHNGVIDIQLMAERLPDIRSGIAHKSVGGSFTPLEWSMLAGTATEEFTRGVAAIARYKMALDQGWPKQEAIRAAKDFVAQTLGDYSKTGRPQVFTGALGSTVGMFKTWLSVVLQNEVKAVMGVKQDPGTFVRYIAANLAVGGLLGLPFASDLDDLLTKYMGWSPMLLVLSNTSRGWQTGLGSIAGDVVGHPELNVDMSAKAGMPDMVPSDLKSLLGPVVGRGYSALQKGIDEGVLRGAEELLIPSSIRNVVNAWTNHLRTRGRQGAVDYTPTESVLKSIGLPPQREGEANRQYKYNSNILEYSDRRQKQLADRILDGSASPAEEEEYYNVGGTNRKLREADKSREMPLLERQARHLPRWLRQKEYP